MITYKRNFDEKRRIYFLIKEEKVSNIIRIKFNSGLIYSKKYLQTEKKHKRKLSMFICTNNID